MSEFKAIFDEQVNQICDTFMSVKATPLETDSNRTLSYHFAPQVLLDIGHQYHSIIGLFSWKLSQKISFTFFEVESESDLELGESVQEFTNMIAGNVKTKVVKEGDISTPRLLKKDEVDKFLSMKHERFDYQVEALELTVILSMPE